MIKVVSAVLLLAVSSCAFADYYDGNDLSTWSDARQRARIKTADGVDYMNSGMLRGLVIGVHDAFENIYICSPSNATNGQIVDTVTFYVSNHPEKRTENASKIALEALSSAYPCKK